MLREGFHRIRYYGFLRNRRRKAGKRWKLWQEEPADSNDNTHKGNRDEDDHPDTITFIRLTT